MSTVNIIHAHTANTGWYKLSHTDVITVDVVFTTFGHDMTDTTHIQQLSGTACDIFAFVDAAAGNEAFERINNPELLPVNEVYDQWQHTIATTCQNPVFVVITNK